MTTLFDSYTNSCSVKPQRGFLGDFLPKIKKTLKQYAFFNLAFLALFCIEIFSCLIFSSLMLQSHLVAVALAIFLLTLFSYFTLKIYFQNKKPTQLIELSKRLLEQLKDNEGVSCVENNLSTASSLTRLAHSLENVEYTLYTPPKNLHSFKQSFEKLSCWLHWKDLHLVKEWLYLETVKIYIELIKEDPENLQFHVALANTYVMFSGIYACSKREEYFEQTRWLPSEKQSAFFQEKFKYCATRAIEEFNILKDHNPSDPWVYMQLAYSYHDLQMPEKEIHAYETIKELSPQDYDAQYKLGTLYFRQGLISKGLAIYESLKSHCPHKAKSLIRHYGSFLEDFSMINA